ncbi:Ca(2+)-dependent cysteine protease [Ceratobasidium sp. 423]|nr:Ca(2+)-dependent cysteine protease [Ceratobasidium sp. 423]
MAGKDPLDTSLPYELVPREKSESRSKPSLPNVQSKPKDEAEQQEPPPEQHEAAQEEPEQPIPGAWVHLTQAVVSAPKPPERASPEKRVRPGLWEELRNAIREGDSILTSQNKATYKARGKVKRRALLVGGQYETDSRTGKLPGTPNDILNVYRMLLRHGYEKENVRILIARAADTTQYKCQPTKKNIVSMKSLDWLVQGAQKEDHRYFHFSGHGEVFESPSGKEARKIPEDKNGVKEDDTELYGDPTMKSRVASQSVSVVELKRYNEALLAYCHDNPPHVERGFDRVKWDNRYRIRDELQGAGFRGSMVGDDDDPSMQPLSPTHAPHATYDQPRGDDMEVGDNIILRNGLNDKPISAVKKSIPLQSPLHETAGSKELESIDVLGELKPYRGSRGLLSLATLSLTTVTNVFRYFSPPGPLLTSPTVQQGVGTPASGRIPMEENLPDEETKKDKIIANMLTWGSCHQRQTAAEWREGGYFTTAFVEAVNDIPKNKSIKVRELFEIVNAKVVEKMRQDMNRKKDQMKEHQKEYQNVTGNEADDDPAKAGGANPQYIQLWTSLGKGSGDSAVSTHKSQEDSPSDT